MFTSFDDVPGLLEEIVQHVEEMDDNSILEKLPQSERVRILVLHENLRNALMNWNDPTTVDPSSAYLRD